MEYFKKLNQAWQDGINAQINDCDGDTRPEVATAFREHYGKYLSEIVIARKPSRTNIEEIGETYTEFSAGWGAAVNKLVKDQPGLIASWVRRHGEYTDYSDLENNDYPAYIVKESDLEQTAS